MTKRILNFVTNVSHFEEPSEPTGLWLSELTSDISCLGAEATPPGVATEQVN